ncbi:hypothetical protein FIBSPDRAFT_879106 [Athelia psychrophila]|uniref:Uncharacterized protein n=1 Tax=Athelia psychrophila TaxID=1759441 RepID=A0A167UD07_9AGAM|nr:hypothetical protein FIBSPDRAFT_879106 [Fibularhizoctonia sp. CBS 109695]
MLLAYDTTSESHPPTRERETYQQFLTRLELIHCPPLTVIYRHRTPVDIPPSMTRTRSQREVKRCYGSTYTIRSTGLFTSPLSGMLDLDANISACEWALARSCPYSSYSPPRHLRRPLDRWSKGRHGRRSRRHEFDLRKPFMTSRGGGKCLNGGQILRIPAPNTNPSCLPTATTLSPHLLPLSTTSQPLTILASNPFIIMTNQAWIAIQMLWKDEEDIEDGCSCRNCRVWDAWQYDRPIKFTISERIAKRIPALQKKISIPEPIVKRGRREPRRTPAMLCTINPPW